MSPKIAIAVLPGLLSFLLAGCDAPRKSLPNNVHLAKSIAAIDGKISCHETSEIFQQKTTKPCDSFTPPLSLSSGQTYVVDGKQNQIGLIGFTQVKEDDPQYGLSAGDFTCFVTDGSGITPYNIETEEGSWLFIKKCRVISQ